MTETWRRYLTAAQLLGGVAGFLGLRVSLVLLGPRGLPPYATTMAALYFALSLAAGVLLWRRHPAGVPLSLAVQLPQIAVVLAPEANLFLLAGAYIRVLLPGSAFNVGFGGGGLLDATILTGPLPSHLGAWLDFGLKFRVSDDTELRAYGVNLVALAATLQLARAWTAGAPPRSPDAAKDAAPEAAPASRHADLTAS